MTPADGLTLARITDRLKREAARAEGFGKTVKLDFGEDGVVLVDARATPPAVSNEDAPADTTLRISLEDFARIVRGELDPARAVFTRKLKIAGDMGAAMKLAQMFRERT
jgi:putative sterol carrier protein